MNEKKKIEIYRGLTGEVVFDVDTRSETIWASQAQMAAIFGVDRTVIGRHLRNIFKEKELDETQVCAKNAHTGPDGKIYQVKMYNLDAIISVGYRVNSKKATSFRIWATSVLKRYVTDGVAVNETRLLSMKDKQDIKRLREVEKMMELVQRLTTDNELNAGEAKGVIEVISRYAGSFRTLEEYDGGHIDLSFMGRGHKEHEISTQMCAEAVEQLRGSVGGSESFGKYRSARAAEGLNDFLTNLAKEKGSTQKKAANLLYYIVKERPFCDGNRRIGALLFILFLTMNDCHLTESGETKISDRALTAIALLIAESKPSEKTLMVSLVCRLLE